MGKRYTRSFSQLSQYSGCSERFRLRRMVRPRLPNRPASWLVGGTAFQAAADQWEISGRTTDLSADFVSLYLAGIDRLKEEQPDMSLWVKPPRTKTVEADIENRMKAGLEKWIPNYLSYAEQGGWEIWKTPHNDYAIEIELEWTFPSGITVKLAIDRVLWWPEVGIISLEDIKTGNRQESASQLNLYMHVFGEVFAEDLEGPMEYARFWYAKDGGVSEWYRPPKNNAEKLNDFYVALDAGISNGVFLPNPGDHCGLCEVKPWCREMGWLAEGESL